MKKRYPLIGLLKSKIIWLFTGMLPLLGNATGPVSFQPTGFIENAGQIQRSDGTTASEVKFVYKKGDLSVFIKEDGISYVVSGNSFAVSEATGEVAKGPKGDPLSREISQYRFDLSFVGKNKTSKVKGKKPASEFINYYKPVIPSGIKADQFESVLYDDVYAGIDLHFYLNDQKQLKYDFILEPGADPSVITLEWAGIDRISIAENGDLQLHTAAGILTEEAPYCFTSDGEVVKSAFRVEGNQVQFDLGSYRKDLALTIDPTLVWSTYYGANGDDLSLAISSDVAGNLYATGYTTSTSFPVTAGAAQVVNNGLSDVFITKFNSLGTRVWTTYYGGTGEDRGYDIHVDGNSDIVVTGSTHSSNFPITASAYQPLHGSIADAFLLKMNSAGNVLYSSYLGGSSDDYGYALATDASNNIYVSGNAQSNNFPVTAGAYQTTHGGGADVFIAKFSPTGTALWITYLGGSLGDESYGMDLDPAGNPVIAGRSFSLNFPVTAGAYQTTKAGGDDAIMASLSSAGTLLWATYFGSTLDDYANDITIDATGNMYITGHTSSAGFPVTAGAFQPAYGGGLYDGFISRFSAAGALVYSSFYGGGGNDQSLAITEDNFGNFYFTGFTQSPNLNLSANAMQASKGTGNDAFLASINPSGSLIYSTYFGGNNDDYGYDIMWNNGAGLLQASGATLSTNFPTASPYQGSNAGSLDLFISSFCNSITNNTIDIAGNDSAEVCVNGPFPLITGTVPSGTGPFSYQWQQNTGSWANITGANGQDYQTSGITASGWYRRIVSNASCSDTSNAVYIKLNQPPTAGIAVNPACVGDLVSFTNISSTATVSDSVISSLWNFGDGNTSTVKHPSHVYATPGSYNVTLVVTTVSGCTDTSTININLDTQPIPSFTAQVNCTNNSVQFTDNSVPTTGFIGFWDWSFGDNTYSQAQNPTHTYPGPGSYTVWLIVETGGGCADTIIDTIQVGMPVTASFSSNTGCSGSATQFTDNSTGSVSNWTWIFGDGDSAFVQNPAHVYASSGTYNVTLIVSSQGCSDTITQTVTIGTGQVSTGFSFAANCASQTVTFTDTSSASSAITGWAWNFGDGNTSTGQNPTHTYLAPGIYNVTLTVTTSTGCTGTFTQTVSVGSAPVAAFTSTGNCSGQPVNFTNISTGTISTYSWNFGDGNTSTSVSPSHNYASAGNYTVTLIVGNGPGCADTISQTVTILTGPVANFTGGNGCLGSPVQFTSSTTGATLLTWDFGNGTTSILPNPSVNYTSAGTYTVTLVASNATGCTDTATQTITIEEQPTAAFNATNRCMGDAVMFSDASTINNGTITSWSWNFGDGSTSNQQNPSHVYASGTSFTVTLTVTSANGCSATTSQTITLSPKPVADFSVDNGCATHDIAFTDLSTGNGITNWNWDFGNGSSSTAQNPYSSYASGGNYPVQLIVMNSAGCSDTIVKTVTIYNAPVVDAGQDVTIQYPGSTQLNATSSINGTFVWTPSDGLTDPSLNNPQARPTVTTTYIVTVTSAQGCTGTDSVTVTVVKDLEIPSAFTPNFDGSNDTWLLRNIGNYPGAIVQIFNRWGSEIFSSIDYTDPWDGQYKGEPLPAGAYFYVVDLNDGSEPIKGTVTLLK